jgi:hypothetical protein
MHAPAASEQNSEIVETQVPPRMDRFPWSGWHWMIVTALGVTWILDGLEVTLASALGATLKNPAALGCRGWEGLMDGTDSGYLKSGPIGVFHG